MDCKISRLTIILSALVFTLTPGAPADDWPTYRHDNGRSGISTERLTTPLSMDWVFTPTHAPSHAWGDPQPKVVEGNLELPRIRFDDVFHVTSAGGRVYFASSSDNKVYALDAKTGRITWEFCTQGPVRLAPTVWDSKVYAGSDDGNVYCLDARTGRKVWTFRAAPGKRFVLGNGKMISLWPVRTGVLIDGDIAYFGAGVFPAEGVALYAVNAKTGKLVWKNDGYGKGGRGSISPQGYMLASKERLFVSSGRGVPATFGRKDGRLIRHTKFIWRRTGLFGGVFNILAGDLLFNGTERMLGFKESDSKLVLSEEARQLVVNAPANVAYALSGKEAIALDRGNWIAKGGSQRRYAAQQRIKRLERHIRYARRRGLPGIPTPRQTADLKKYRERLAAEEKRWGELVKWRTKCLSAESIALTRELLFAGGVNVVEAFDTASGRQVFSAPIDGKARGLAVADGRLLVSSDKGNIYCFVPGKTGANRKIAQKTAAGAFSGGSKDAAATASAIVKETSIKRGYALILGGSGRLAAELAKRTELMIYVVNPTAGDVAAARKALSAAGLYGARVVVMQGKLDALPFSSYFANLIVADSASATPAAEILRMLKPCGGVAYVGSSAERVKAMQKHLAQLGEKETKVSLNGGRAKVTRGPLKGAGRWTHQYGEPGNTSCGDDQLVRAPISLLWYGEPGPGRMPSRHASAASPLAIGGRMFVQGENLIMAYDAYNGVLLWERNIPGAMRLGLKTGCANLTANEDSLFVAIGDRCLRIDAATGKTLKSYKVPPASDGRTRRWEYLACVGGMLYGSRGSECIFALDIETGKLAWKHDGYKIMTVTICIGDGRVFYVDRTVAKNQVEKCLKDVPPAVRVDKRGKPIKPDVRLVVAIDAKTGKTKWTKPHYVSDCVPPVTKAHGDLTMMYAKNVVLLCGQPWNGHFWRDFFSGGFSRRSLIALSGDDGRILWSGRKGYRSRPLIIGDQVIAEPWAHDLRTGTEKMRPNPITGAQAKWQFARPGHHCGNIAAAPKMLFFRSGTTAYYDLVGDYGTEHFGAQRPGCWINCIPANGLVMMPEAASGCVCPTAVQCTVVFAPQKTRLTWGMFSAPGATTPVKRLGINFGAPGDRKNAKGELWLSYPRPHRGRLVLELKVNAKVDKKGGYYNRSSDFLKLAGTNDAWIYASGCRGISECTIPLLGKKDKPRKYTVRLHFAEPDSLAAGKRVVNISLQGKPCLKQFDIAKAAGGQDKAVVKEFTGIEVTSSLKIKLEGIDAGADKKHVPVLSGIEAVAE